MDYMTLKEAAVVEVYNSYSISCIVREREL